MEILGDMLDNLFLGYMVEQHEKTNQKLKIEEFISYLAAAEDPDDTTTQMEIAAECGLNLDNLTEDEKYYIAVCVNDIREANM
jgi:hypothetical protein